MRCFICRLLLLGALGFTLIFASQTQLDLANTFQALSSLAVLVAVSGVLLLVWRHFKEWRRPLIIIGSLALGIVALAAVATLPGLREFLGQLLRGISFEGPLPLVFAVMCLITYGVIGLARSPSSS